MKKQILLFLISTCLSGILLSQSAEITNVRKREFKGVYPIINSITNEAQGYYTFYVNEKVGGGKINFIVAIYDIEMKLVKQTPITITKYSNVDGSEFNGKEFMFIFNDYVKKTLTYVTVDANGDIIKTVGIKEEKRYAATADVYSSQDGFYIVKPIKEKKWGYSIEKIDRELNTKWEKRFVVEKGMVGVEAIQSGEDRIIVIQVAKPSLMSTKVAAEIVCLSDISGDELYRYPLYDGTNTCMPSAFLIDKEKNIVTGGMYFDGEKWDATNSDGIFFLKLSPEGKKVSLSLSDWDEGIQKFLKEGTKKTVSISSKPKILFHEIIEGTDGNYQVVGETFKKNIQVVSSALKDVITGRFIGEINSNNNNNKPVTFEVLDFIIFNFDGAGKITNLALIEKEHTKISCYPPYNSYGGLSLALAVKKFGFFNFGFMTNLPESDQPLLISAVFTEKEPYIGINTIDQGKETVFHKIPVTRKTIKGGSVGTMISKPGYLGIYIYDKKEESILMYLEKIQMK
ncbi:MAG: DUF6770 family protein [Bacteroidota bacterium]